MVSFPNCKINLGLRVTGKRADGYHDIETVFYPLPIQDALEIITATGQETRFSQSGKSIPGPSTDNLCLKAYQLVKEDFPDLPPVWIHLHKAIPAGAGLGGGSADASFTLMALNKKYQLELNEKKLSDYAIAIGSDCPFFLKNQPALGSGRGEKLVPVDLDLSAYRFVIVNPGIHISTAWAFSQIKPAIPADSLSDIIRKPVSEWRDKLVNDFEKVVEDKHPEIKSIREALYNQGALYAAMSGSGSTVYGIFEKGADLKPAFPDHYYVKTV